ncbi:MAG: S49 family peptidase, partial [Janthinobacterium lividum]
VDDLAASAAYWIASAADRIVVSRTGMVGSIGVIAFHTDITRALDSAGITVTTLQYGARKSDGAPTTPMTSAARQRMQADIDSLGDLFTQTVARNRGLRARDVRGFEAGTFLGRDAVRAGLADSVMSPDEAFLELMDAATERPAARPSARAAQRRDTPKALKKKVPTMATNSDFAHLRQGGERSSPARKASKPSLGQRVLAAAAKADGKPVPVAAAEAGPEQPRRIRITGADIVATMKKHGKV